MRIKIMAAIAIMLESLSAGATNQSGQIKMSEIAPDIQRCLVLATAPKHRSLIKMTLDGACYQTLTDEQKLRALEVISELQEQNFSSNPEQTKHG